MMKRGKTWRERIAEAKKRGKFTDQEVRLALSWHTCSVGEQRARCPRAVIYKQYGGIYGGYPVDADLWRLGRVFSDAARGGNVHKASKILDLIEARVLTLNRKTT